MAQGGCCSRTAVDPMDQRSTERSLPLRKKKCNRRCLWSLTGLLHHTASCGAFPLARSCRTWPACRASARTSFLRRACSVIRGHLSPALRLGTRSSRFWGRIQSHKSRQANRPPPLHRRLRTRALRQMPRCQSRLQGPVRTRIRCLLRPTSPTGQLGRRCARAAVVQRRHQPTPLGSSSHPPQAHGKRHRAGGSSQPPPRLQRRLARFPPPLGTIRETQRVRRRVLEPTTTGPTQPRRMPARSDREVPESLTAQSTLIHPGKNSRRRRRLRQLPFHRVLLRHSERRARR